MCVHSQHSAYVHSEHGVKIEGKWTYDSDITQNYEKLLDKEGIPTKVARLYSFKKLAEVVLAYAIKDDKDEERGRSPAQVPLISTSDAIQISVDDHDEIVEKYVPKTHYFVMSYGKETIEYIVDGKSHNCENFGLNVAYKCSVDSRGRFILVLQGKGKGNDTWKIEERWGLVEDTDESNPKPMTSNDNHNKTDLMKSGAEAALKTSGANALVDLDDDEERIQRTVNVIIKRSADDPPKGEGSGQKEEGEASEELVKVFELRFKRGVCREKRRGLQKRSMSVGGKKNSKSALFASQKTPAPSISSTKQTQRRSPSPAPSTSPTKTATFVAPPSAVSPALKTNKPRYRLSLPGADRSNAAATATTTAGAKQNVSPRNLFK